MITRELVLFLLLPLEESLLLIHFLDKLYSRLCASEHRISQP